MPPQESSDRSQRLQSLISEYLAAEGRQGLDRHALIADNPDLAAELSQFFANRDQSAGGSDAATIPPHHAPSDETLVLDAQRSAEAPATGQPGYFGDYELLGEIARGGMGVVFKARQTKLNRIVALKMILAGQFAGEKDVQRFHTEAESAAQLDHPGIVPVFETGEHQGQCYFSMGYVEGESLAEKVAAGPLPPREAAEFTQKIAEAMAYAHGRGVIHRDLKPANVLIDASGQPKITDFGLAKKTESDSELTGTGQILGTPAYMPPEQASGKVALIGPASDIYSLGAILYCLLTGRPPFQAASPTDALLQVLDQDPIPVRQLVPTVARDLATICAKCLSKDPAKRYASASHLAADLQRFLDDQPILARPASLIERASKWAAKQPTVAAVLLTMPAWLLGEPKIGVGLLALIAGFHLPFRFRFLRLLAAAVAALVVTALVGGLSYLFVWFSGDSPGSLARLAAISLLSAAAPAGVTLFVFIYNCVSELVQPQRRQARRLLGGSAMAALLCIAGFVYYLRYHSEELSTIVDQLGSEIGSLTTGGDPATTEATSSDAMMQLFRSRMVLWIPVYTAIVWLYLALGIIAARLIRGFVFVSEGPAKRGQSHSRLVKTVDGDVSRWVAIAAAVAIAILPYGIGRLLGLYDVDMMRAFEQGNTLYSFFWVVAAAWLAAFSVVSRRRFVIATTAGICLLLLLCGRTLRSLADGLQASAGAGTSQAVSDDLIASAFEGHDGPVKCVAADSAGQLVASASGWPHGDGTIRLWDLASGRMLWLRRLEPQQMMTATFSSDSQRLISGAHDGTVYVWEVATARELGQFRTLANLEGMQLFSQDKFCAIAADHTQIWNLETAELVRQFEGTRDRQLDVAVSGDGKRIASGGMENAVHVWDIANGNQVKQIAGFQAVVESVAINHDGSRLLVGLAGDSDRPLLQSISVADPSDRVTFSGHTAAVNWVRFSPDERLVVTASRDATVRVWDSVSGSELKTFVGHRDWVWSAVFTADGRKILSGGGGVGNDNPGTDWALRLWEYE